MQIQKALRYIPLFTNKGFQYLIYMLGFYDTRLKVYQWSNNINNWTYICYKC